ncbi:MAG: 2-hydroxychromene-2-carboxylate isomerase [Betaproteobacteria bacterium]|nr:2-hydroxychromene-2-carboxylate isomerase [Betaproteobacteria bacterium]
MRLIIDYYMAPQSPWTYLGHARLTAMAKTHDALVRIKPVDIGGQIFPASGGLPVGQRPPQRQAYRLIELQRFSHFLQLPLNLHPRFFPVAGDDAARLIIAVAQHEGDHAAMQLGEALLKVVWAQERNLADHAVLAEVLQALQLPPERLAQSQQANTQAVYQAHTEEALALGVFGAPTYVLQGELFWGQDRLDFLERRLLAG